MVRLADRPDMTIAVYRGYKTTTQHQQHAVDTVICVIIIIVYFYFVDV